MKNTEFKLLCIAGLFSKSSINAEILGVFKKFLRISDKNVLSIDLEGCSNIQESIDYIQSKIHILGENVIIVGHSAGGQLAKHFIDNPSVTLIVTISAPTHNPLEFPLWLWIRTLRFLGKIMFNKFFRLPKDTGEQLFGRTTPESMTGDSWGRLFMQMNLGSLTGNPAPKIPRRGAPCLFVACSGDRLITPDVVRKNAKKFHANYLLLDHPDHFPQIGPNAKRNLYEIILEVEELLPDSVGRAVFMK